MKKYYIGNVEVSEADAQTLVGNDTTRPYIRKVYRGEITIDDVPEELRDAVTASVEARIARDGEYGTHEISAAALKSMIEGVM